MTEEVTGRRTLVLEGSIGSKRQKADELRRLPRGEMAVFLSAVRFQRKLLRLPLTRVRASKSGVTHAEIVTCAQALWRVPCQARARRPAPVDASPRQAGPHLLVCVAFFCRRASATVSVSPTRSWGPPGCVTVRGRALPVRPTAGLSLPTRPCASPVGVSVNVDVGGFRVPAQDVFRGALVEAGVAPGGLLDGE